MTISEIAAYYKISEAMLCRWLREGIIPEGMVLFDVSSITEHLAERSKERQKKKKPGEEI